MTRKKRVYMLDVFYKSSYVEKFGKFHISNLTLKAKINYALCMECHKKVKSALKNIENFWSIRVFENNPQDLPSFPKICQDLSKENAFPVH